MMNAELRSICERIARIERERKELATEIAEIKKDAKDSGFDVALITKAVRIMNLAPKKKQEALEQHELFDTYLGAAGLLPAFEANKSESDRDAVKARATRHRMEDTASLSMSAADAGLISQESAEETARIAQAINDKWGDKQDLKPVETKLWATPDIAKSINEIPASGPSGAGESDGPGEAIGMANPGPDVPHDPVTGEVIEDVTILRFHAEISGDDAKGILAERAA